VRFYDVNGFVPLFLSGHCCQPPVGKRGFPCLDGERHGQRMSCVRQASHSELPARPGILIWSSRAHGWVNVRPSNASVVTTWPSLSPRMVRWSARRRRLGRWRSGWWTGTAAIRGNGCGRSGKACGACCGRRWLETGSWTHQAARTSRPPNASRRGLFGRPTSTGSPACINRCGRTASP
jgi:hypothetical protein